MQLTVRISGHSLSFAQLENDGTVSHEPYHTQGGMSIAANLRQAFGESRLLAGSHDCVRVLVDSPVMLVPAEEFDDGKATDLYSYTFGLDKSCGVVSEGMDEENVVAVFSVNKDLRLVLDDNFREVRLLPQVLPVWRVLHRDSYNTPSRRMYAWLHDKCMELVAFRQDRFAFSNRFDVTQAADAVYFLLNVWKQLGMKNRDDELCVLGDCDGEGKFLPMVKEYVVHASQVEASALFGNDWACRTSGLPLDLQALFYDLQ